ncbi:MAG TPA: tubulin-like doman-containing protein, partial [Syntrophobacteraceae bacterium]|nr:tubulin-like doman-containing protein [Syntrophobacteraceae bacterium]
MFINRSEIKVTPSVIIGCEGKGTEAVVRCRDLVQQEIFRGNPDALRDFDPLQFLVVDSGPQPLESSGTDHGIETLSIAFDRIERVIDNPDFPASGSGVVKILRQMPEFRDYKGMLTALPSSSLGNSTCPPLGAMNFLASWNSIKEGLRARLMYWKQESKTGIKTNDWKKYNQIFIVAGLFGGTGSGTHIHLAAMLRSLLAELEIPNTAIYGIFLLPDIIENADDAGKMKLRANAYSCLKELDHFLSGNPYTLEMDTKKLIVSNTTKDMLFNKVFLVND